MLQLIRISKESIQKCRGAHLVYIRLFDVIQIPVDIGRFLQSLAIYAPELTNRSTCQLFEHTMMVFVIFHPSIQFANGTFSIAILDPVEKVCGFIITFVPAFATSSSPVRWGQSFMKTNKVCKLVRNTH